MKHISSLLLLAMLAVCAACSVHHGAPKDLEPEARAALLSARVVWASRDGVYIARGDGSDSDRIVKGSDLGKNAGVFLPSMPADDANRLLFLSLLDLNPVDASGTHLTLEILDLEGDRITFWRHISLAKIVPAGAGGRYTLFSVPAVAWSADGKNIALALRREEPAGDAVLLMDGEGNPTALIDIAPQRFSRGTSLSWDLEHESLFLGLQGSTPDDAGVVGVIGRKGLGPIHTVGPGAYPAVSSNGRIAVVEPGDTLALLGRDGERIDRLEGAEGRAKNRLFWSRDGRYLYYYALVPSGPLGMGQVTVLRCLDTRAGGVFDLVRLR